MDREATPSPIAFVRDDAVRRVLGKAVRRGPGMGGSKQSRDRVIGACDAHPGDPGEELVERGGETREAAVVVEVVGLDVGDDAGFGGELEERAVALVGFDHEPFTLVVRGVGADLVEIAPDDEARPPTGGAQDQRQHRRRCRLAVTAGDGDGPVRRGQRAERVGTSQHGQAAFEGGANLGVRVGDGRRDDHRVEVRRHVLGAVTDLGVNAEEPEPFEPARLFQVGTGDAVAHPGEHGCDRAHARSPDPDDVDAPR
jgi:hypothetical protein